MKRIDIDPRRIVLGIAAVVGAPILLAGCTERIGQPQRPEISSLDASDGSSTGNGNGGADGRGSEYDRNDHPRDGSSSDAHQDLDANIVKPDVYRGPDAGADALPPAPDTGIDALVADAGVPPNLTNFRRPYGCDDATLLLHHYNEATPFVDACGSNDATNVGTIGVEGPTTEFGQARQCTATTYLFVADNDSLSPISGSFTAEAWIRPSAYSSASYILGRNGDAEGSREFYLYLGGDGRLAGGKSADCSSDGGQYTFGSSVIPLDVWTHVALRYNGDSNTLDILVNGVVDGTATPSPSGVCLASTANFTVARNGSFGAPFSGDVDEVRYSNAARDLVDGD